MLHAEDAGVTQRLVDGLERELTQRIIQCGMTVHTELGPGLLESIYEESLCHEMHGAGLAFERQVQVPVRYRGRLLAAALRTDLIVEQRVIVEVKAVDLLTRVHDAQLLTYMRLAGKTVGLLMNFNVAHLRHGIRRKIFSVRHTTSSA